ncbi:hypothetical protein ACLB1Q_34860 [Escherichia coli]
MKIATTFYGDGAYQLKKPLLEIKQKERSPRILCFTAIAALIRFCHSIARELGFPLHGATSPTRLAAFLIEFLTEPGDLVVDPFAGLHKVRRSRATWQTLAGDGQNGGWLAISRNLFTAAPGYRE